MSYGLFNLTSKYHGDRLYNTTKFVALFDKGIGYAFDTSLQTFSLAVSGTYTLSLTTLKVNNDVSVDPVSAEMITVDIVPENNIMARTTNDYLYIMSAIANNSVTVRKYSDFFTQKNEAIYDSIRLYNDGQEVNSAVTTAIFGGSRSSIVHADIPVRSGDVKGFAIGLEVNNEAVIKSIKITNEDTNVGGDR